MGKLRNAYRAVDQAAAKVAERPRGKVIAGGTCPPGRCPYCTRRIKPEAEHCNRPACVRQAAAEELGETSSRRAARTPRLCPYCERGLRPGMDYCPRPACVREAAKHM
jgi:hypothetical protein